jgi:hypothetical protein
MISEFYLTEQNIKCCSFKVNTFVDFYFGILSKGSQEEFKSVIIIL